MRGKERSKEKKEAGKKSPGLRDSTTFVSHGPLLRLRLASRSVRSRSILGRREIRSRSSERWRTLLGMSSSACLRTTRPLRPEPKKTRRRGNGRGRQGLRKRPGKEDIPKCLFFFLSQCWGKKIPLFWRPREVGCKLVALGSEGGWEKCWGGRKNVGLGEAGFWRSPVAAGSVDFWRLRKAYYSCLRPGVVRVGQVSLSFSTPSSSTILGTIQETNHQLSKGLRSLENVTWIDGEGKGQRAEDGKEIQSPGCSFLAHNEVIAPTTRVFVRSKRDSMCKRLTVLST